MKARVQNTLSPALWLYTPGEGHEKTALAVMAAASETGAAFHPFGPESAGMKLRALLAGGGPVPAETPPEEPVLLIQGFDRKGLDAVLRALREKTAEMGAVPVALKAVVTPTNLDWTVEALARELRQEHRLMHGEK